MELNKILQARYFKSASMTEIFMIKNLYEKHQRNCALIGCYCRDAVKKNNPDAMLKNYQLMAVSIMEDFCGKFE